MKLSDVTDDRWDFVTDRVEKQKQGYYLYYKGNPYPRRFYHSSLNDPNHHRRVLEALGLTKKFLFSFAYLPAVVIPRTMSLKKWDGFLGKVTETAKWHIQEYFLEDDEWSVPVWEIGKLVKSFLAELGFGIVVYTYIPKIIMLILEFDFAYRYRLQDIIGSVSITWFMMKPQEGIKQMLKNYEKREGLYGAHEKIHKIGTILKWIIWIPKIRKAYLKAWGGVVYSNILLDKNDRFYVSHWRGYDYEGKSFDERYEPYSDLIKTIPYKKQIDPKVIANFMTE